MAFLGQRPGVIPADGKEGGGERESVCVWQAHCVYDKARVSLMLSQRVTLNWAGEVAQPHVLKPGILSAILGTVYVVGGETGSLQAVLCSPHMYSTIHFF